MNTSTSDPTTTSKTTNKHVANLDKRLRLIENIYKPIQNLHSSVLAQINLENLDFNQTANNNNNNKFNILCSLPQKPLVEKELEKDLIQNYFCYIHPLIPIVNKKLLSNTNDNELVCLCVVGLGSIFSHSELSLELFTYIKYKVEMESINMFTLNTGLVYLLISIYDIFVHNKLVSGSIYISLCIKTLQHLDVYILDNNINNNTDVNKEDERRCWFVCNYLDRMIHNLLDRQISIQDSMCIINNTDYTNQWERSFRNNYLVVENSLPDTTVYVESSVYMQLLSSMVVIEGSVNALVNTQNTFLNETTVQHIETEAKNQMVYIDSQLSLFYKQMPDMFKLSFKEINMILIKKEKECLAHINQTINIHLMFHYLIVVLHSWQITNLSKRNLRIMDQYVFSARRCLYSACCIYEINFNINKNNRLNRFLPSLIPALKHALLVFINYKMYPVSKKTFDVNVGQYILKTKMCLDKLKSTFNLAQHALDVVNNLETSFSNGGDHNDSPKNICDWNVLFWRFTAKSENITPVRTNNNNNEI